MMDGGGWNYSREFFKEYKKENIPGNTGAQMGGWFRYEDQIPGSQRASRFRCSGPAVRCSPSSAWCPADPQVATSTRPQPRKAPSTPPEWIGPYDDQKLGFNKGRQVPHYPGAGKAARRSPVREQKQWAPCRREYQTIPRRLPLRPRRNAGPLRRQEPPTRSATGWFRHPAVPFPTTRDERRLQGAHELCRRNRRQRTQSSRKSTRPEEIPATTSCSGFAVAETASTTSCRLPAAHSQGFQEVSLPFRDTEGSVLKWLLFHLRPAHRHDTRCRWANGTPTPLQIGAKSARIPRIAAPHPAGLPDIRRAHLRIVSRKAPHDPSRLCPPFLPVYATWLVVLFGARLVLGMALLMVYLIARRGPDEHLRTTAGGLLVNLPLFRAGRYWR